MKRVTTLLVILSMFFTAITGHAQQITSASVDIIANSGVSLMSMGDYGGNLTGATWYWPLHGFTSTSSAYSKITSSYGYRGGSYKAYHKGMDIGASKGTAVYPTRNGTVSTIHNSTSGSAGRYIIINHNDGYFSIYMHLSSINISQGQSVDVNTQIGAVGGSGYGNESKYANHLHIGIHYGSSFDWQCNVNPCPSGYTRIGSSMQESAGGYSIGNATISYSVNVAGSEIPTITDSQAPIISNLNASNVNGSAFTISCDLSDNVGVTRVWLNIYGPGGSKGYEVSASNGYFSHIINTADYGGAGIYSVHIYAFDSAGNSSANTLNDINAVDDTEAPVICNLYTTNVTSDSFTINCEVYDNIAVTRAWIIVWGPGGNSGNGYSLSVYNNFTHTINTADYGGRGIYTVHVYVYDSNGNGTVAALNDINAISDAEPPIVYRIRPNHVSASEFTIDCEMYDNIGVTRAWVNIYGPSGSDGYSVPVSNNSFSHTISTSKYGGSGWYSIHVYAWDDDGNTASNSLTDFYVSDDHIAPQITKVSVDNVSDSSFTVSCEANEKIVRAWVNIYGPGLNDGYAIYMYDTQFTHTIYTSKYGGAGAYEVHVYVWDSADNESSGRSTGSFVANKRYTVNFNANQGTTPLSYIIVTNTSTYGELPTPTRKGYTFSGWFTSSIGGEMINENSIVGLSSSQTLYAHWNANSYDIQLDSNGGDINKQSITVTYDSLYSNLSTPTRKGYRFNGWYTELNGGTQITNDTKVTITNNQTLYAQWEKLVPRTETVVIKRGTDYNVTVTPIDIEDNCHIIIAAYKESEFVTLSDNIYDFNEISTTLSGDIDEVKVMVWNSLSGLMPLCEAEVIPNSEFIIE